MEDCAEQLADLSYSDFYSPLELLENYDVNKYTHRASQTYIKNKITNAVKINKLYFSQTKFITRQRFKIFVFYSLASFSNRHEKA